jgi:hypothetical protein
MGKIKRCRPRFWAASYLRSKRDAEENLLEAFRLLKRIHHTTEHSEDNLNTTINALVATIMEIKQARFRPGGRGSRAPL